MSVFQAGDVAVLAGFSNPDDGGLISASGGLFYGVISGVSIHVTFGRVEHTPRLLVGIAHNTTDAAGFEPPEGYVRTRPAAVLSDSPRSHRS